MIYAHSIVGYSEYSMNSTQSPSAIVNAHKHALTRFSGALFQVAGALKAILATPVDKESTPLGAFTTMNRDAWADVRFVKNRIAIVDVNEKK